jgi:hypothetical protein
MMPAAVALAAGVAAVSAAIVVAVALVTVVVDYSGLAPDPPEL